MTLSVVALSWTASILPFSVQPVRADQLDASNPSSLSAEIEDDERLGEDGTTSPTFSEPELQAETPKADVAQIVDDVKIVGNRLVPTEQIASVVKTKPGDKFDKNQVMQDLQAINEMGYFDDKSLQVTPEVTSSGVLLKIRVVENAPVTQFSFDGNNVIPSAEISKLFADQLGKPQNLNQLSSSISQVEDMYHQKGYLLARVTDVKDDPDGSVSLKINEGIISGIEIKGNRKTKDFIVRNSIDLKPGSVYNEQQLSAGLKKLYANGYFQDIRRSLAPSATDPDKFTLTVEVDEKRTGAVGVGGGVDSAAGPFGSLSFSDANFRGKGQVLSFSGNMGAGLAGLANQGAGGQGVLPSARTFQAEVNFLEPHLKGTNTSMNVSGFGRNYASMVVDQSTQRSIGGSVSFGRQLRRNTNFNLGLMGERTTLADYASTFGADAVTQSMAARALQLGQASSQLGAEQLAASVRADQLKGGTFLTVNPSLSYDTRNAYIDATRGTYAKVSAGPSLGLSGSAFVKAGASVSKFVPLKGDDVTLALNGQAGAALGGLPQFAQYRLGGWNGVRGYGQFTDLGVGTNLLMATAEVRSKIPFLPKDSGITKFVDKHVKVALFADAGSVGGNRLSNDLLSRSPLAASVGVGLRIKVPMIGLMRLDYGIPLINSVLGGMTPRFTVGFGDKF